MANATTQEIVNRAETQIRSLGNAPNRVAGKVATDLELSVKQLEGILEKAWAYLERYKDKEIDHAGEEAFTRYEGVLDVYQRGTTALDEYRSRRSAYGNEP